ncbi:MAG: hypothetical protein ABEJ04_02485 [Halobacteriaceae archaeon]
MTVRGPGTRGQAHTLEAIAAGVVLLAAVVFALQATTVTPLTASTSSQHIENQEESLARGALVVAAEQGNLTPTLLYRDNASEQFWGVNDHSVYSVGGPPTAFGETLNETFRDRGIAFNLNVYYLQTASVRRQREVVEFGVPSDHAVRATRTVTLYDDQHLRYENGTVSPVTLAESGLYGGDIDPSSPVYNVVVVEVVAWRM